jgi:hypothetical protein
MIFETETIVALLAVGPLYSKLTLELGEVWQRIQQATVALIGQQPVCTDPGIGLARLEDDFVNPFEVFDIQVCHGRVGKAGSLVLAKVLGMPVREQQPARLQRLRTRGGPHHTLHGITVAVVVTKSV